MILRYLKFLFLAILLVALFWATFNYKLVAYGWAQFKGQWHIVYNARPLDEVLKDSQVSDSLKLKIQFIEKVSRYAQDSLGLKNRRITQRCMISIINLCCGYLPRVKNFS
ncbi:MAG: aminopeptidase [Bacteroidetes bacterium]|nr:aminopeptidase [Bacteroidota bacterium]